MTAILAVAIVALKLLVAWLVVSAVLSLVCGRFFSVCCPREEQEERDAASYDSEG